MSDLDLIKAILEKFGGDVDMQVNLPEGWNRKEVTVCIRFEDGKMVSKEDKIPSKTEVRKRKG